MDITVISQFHILNTLINVMTYNRALQISPTTIKIPHLAQVEPKCGNKTYGLELFILYDEKKSALTFLIFRVEPKCKIILTEIEGKNK